MTPEEKIAEIQNRINSMSTDEFVEFMKTHISNTVTSFPEEALDKLLTQIPEVTGG